MVAKSKLLYQSLALRDTTLLVLSMLNKNCTCQMHFVGPFMIFGEGIHQTQSNKGLSVVLKGVEVFYITLKGTSFLSIIQNTSIFQFAKVPQAEMLESAVSCQNKLDLHICIASIENRSIIIGLISSLLQNVLEEVFMTHLHFV